MDMDAFYAAIEQLDNPALRGRPVIVGGGARGVVSTASYEARAFGVHSAMPMFQARRLCPHGVFLPVRMDRYQEVSARIMALLHRVTPAVEQVSVDEAYLDLTGTETLYGAPVRVARTIKDHIARRTGLTCSIGLAPNKFLAKIGSDWSKPDGLTVIEEHQIAGFLKNLPVDKLPGVGKKAVQTLKSLGINQTGDLARFPGDVLIRRFGKFGRRLVELAHGIDPSEVVSEAEPKSISSEDTLPEDTDNLTLLADYIAVQAGTVGRRLRQCGLKGRTVTLKLKYTNFHLLTRSHTMEDATQSTKTIRDVALELLRKEKLVSKIRLVGVGVSHFDRGTGQLHLFRDLDEKQTRLDRAVDQVSERFGKDILKRGV
jgi:DNA polymerase-4